MANNNDATRSKFIIANWKMNNLTKTNQTLVDELLLASDQLEEINVILCPPFVYLHQINRLIQDTSYQLGAQNCFYEVSGAYTGEISAAMLRDADCRYVIIGHSERRELFTENNEVIARKFLSAYHAGIVPILCVGETGSQRKNNETFPVIEQQLSAVLKTATGDALASTIIAYEPVWAIGTGLTATPEQAEEVHMFIRKQCAEVNETLAARVSIIYGGSVKANNADRLFQQKNIDGALVGGASLIASEFISICRSAVKAI